LSAINRNRRGGEIGQFDDAENQQKLLILWVYTNSIERRWRSAKANSERFFSEILNTPEATAELARCLCVKVDIVGLDEGVRREYDMGRSAPQLLMFSYDGDLIGRLSTNIDADGLGQAIAQARERNDQIAERAAARRR
jgi:hypothetical protein